MSLPTLDIPLSDFLNWQDGEVRLTGHWINLYGVIRRYEEGYSAEMVVLHYPSLSLAHVHKVITFYLENQPAVGKYVPEYHMEMEEQERRHQPRVTPHILRERITMRHALPIAAASCSKPCAEEPRSRIEVTPIDD